MFFAKVLEKELMNLHLVTIQAQSTSVPHKVLVMDQFNDYAKNNEDDEEVQVN